MQFNDQQSDLTSLAIDKASYPSIKDRHGRGVKMGKIYKDDIGTVIKVDCGTDLTGATAMKIKVKKPDGTKVEWSASIVEVQKLAYTIVSGDLDQDGTYYLNASLTLNGWSGLGETASFVVYDPYN